MPALLVGIRIAETCGVPAKAFAPNLIALVLGTLGFVLAGRATLESLARRMPPVAALAMLGTLLAPGLEGVHRWLPLGPLRLHVSSVVAPWVFFGLLSSSRETVRRSLVLLTTVQIVHFVQPDAGQATAFSAGALPLLLSSVRKCRSAGVVALGLVALAVATWFRSDPLPPVEHVERVLYLAAARGYLASGSVVVGATFLFVPFIVRTKTSSDIAAALVLYLSMAFGVTFFGNFPVPVFGAGAGPMLGWFALLSVSRAQPGRKD